MIVHFMKRSDCKRKGLVGGRTSPQTPHQGRRRAPLISSLLKSPRECADFFSLRRLRLRFLLKVASPLRRWLRHLYAPRFAWSNASQGVGLGKLVFLFSPFSLFFPFFLFFAFFRIFRIFHNQPFQTLLLSQIPHFAHFAPIRTHFRLPMCISTLPRNSLETPGNLLSALSTLFPKRRAGATNPCEQLPCQKIAPSYWNVYLP